MPVLGYAANKNADPKRLDAFKKGLTELGYTEGKNISINYREGVFDPDYQQLMAEFVAAKIQIILAANAPAAVAARQATTTIPVVQSCLPLTIRSGLDWSKALNDREQT